MAIEVREVAQEKLNPKVDLDQFTAIFLQSEEGIVWHWPTFLVKLSLSFIAGI